VSTIRRPEDNAPLLRLARGVPVLVRVFNVEDAEAVRIQGGTPILYSQAAAEDFLSWFDTFRAAGRPLGEPAETANISKVVARADHGPEAAGRGLPPRGRGDQWIPVRP
jgi:hypothetical protein